MNIFIGCSSKNNINKQYFESSVEILNQISQNNNLVFGVSPNGIMGLCYEKFKNNNQKIIGITNDTYKQELKTVPCNEEYIVTSTLDRTKQIIKYSDIFLFLPGGLGTYAEIFQIYEELRTYNINKKIIIYNYNNYYIDIINILNKITKENFMDKEILKYITITTDKKEIINLLKK